MDNFTYSNSVKHIFGRGQLAQVGTEAAQYGRKVLLVYGREHLRRTGTYDQLVGCLKAAGMEIVELGGVHPNPRVELVREGIRLCREHGVEVLLGAGGGSVCDTTKAIAFGALLDGDVWEAYETFHQQMHGSSVAKPVVPQRCMPFGIVMTKPGTGSDFDYTSVLSNRHTQEKLMVINKTMYPRFSIIDPELAFGLPREEAMYGVADIMSHIMEQYLTGTPDVEIMDQYKEADLRVAIEAGRRCLANPRDYAAWAYLFYIASWACSDQSMTGTQGGWAAHMIEHELSAATDLNHGHGMAIVYAGWMPCALPSLPGKFARFAEKVWDIPRAGLSDLELGRLAIEKTVAYWRDLGITISLKSVDIGDDVIERAAKQAVRFGSLGSVRPLDQRDVEAILRSVA